MKKAEKNSRYFESELAKKQKDAQLVKKNPRKKFYELKECLRPSQDGY